MTAIGTAPQNVILPRDFIMITFCTEQRLWHRWKGQESLQQLWIKGLGDSKCLVYTRFPVPPYILHVGDLYNIYWEPTEVYYRFYLPKVDWSMSCGLNRGL